MSGLTVANYLGLLLEDPYDAQLVEGLRERLKSPEPANDGQDPLRLLEAARGGHERRGEFLAASWLMELETELVGDDPVEDCVCKGGFTYHIMPCIDGELAGDQG